MKEYTECKICNGNIQLVNEKYRLGQCDDCRLVFCVTVFSQQEFIAVYDQLYNDQDAIYSNHSVTEYNMLRNNEKIRIGHNRARLLRKHILNGKCQSVLEIGSGIGLIGAYIRKENSAIGYLGIEIDEKSFAKSQELNLKAINGDFTAMESIGEQFDVIMLWEVIEHLQDLDQFLKLALQRLQPGGRIILSTPNYDKIYNYPNRQEDEIFQDKPPVHLNFFTKQNISNIFELRGFGNCRATTKKLPYVDIKRLHFYKDFIKAVFGKYEGSTIYFEATKPV